LNQSRIDLEKISRSLDLAEALPSLYRPQFDPARRFPYFGKSGDQILLNKKMRSVEFSKTARDPIDVEIADFLSEATIPDWQQTYSTGKVSPVGVLRYIQQDPIVKNTAIFPRDITKGPLGRQLLEKAMESERRFLEGNPRPLEGVIVPVKDTFPGLDGIMMVGSKTTRISGVKDSPVIKALLEAGAIPIPVGMVAAANGGSGMNAGFGYIPHPHRSEFDPGGSSSATAYTIGRKRFPMTVGIGTDTGGSVTAPAGAVGLAGFVPPKHFLSTDNMVPFDTFLDRVGVLALHPQDALFMVRQLTRPLNGHAVKALQPSPERPRMVYVEEVLKQASPQAKAHFLAQMEKYQAEGYDVIPLGEQWNFLVEAPLLLYPIDAYGAAAFAHTNPLQKNLWEPPRRSLDRNLWTRLPRGEISLRYGLFDQARQLTKRYQDLVRSKLGPQTVLASPSTEAIPKVEIENGRAGSLLDQHDRITMAKNRMPEWGQINLPAKKRGKVGVVFSGSLENLTQFL
jgi:Asp-tRNA(Asn)/Glu-tRNA(Gln) amidotransferase A subunit family amidase